MKYYALIQGGEGCDYSIACGKDYVEIKGVTDLHSAKLKFMDMVLNIESDDYAGYQNELALTSAIIISVADEEELWMDSLYKQQKEIKEFEQRKIKEEERAEYERLRTKFGQ